VTVYKALDEGLEAENTKYSVLGFHSYALAHYYILKTFLQQSFGIGSWGGDHWC